MKHLIFCSIFWLSMILHPTLNIVQRLSFLTYIVHSDFKANQISTNHRQLVLRFSINAANITTQMLDSHCISSETEVWLSSADETPSLLCRGEGFHTFFGRWGGAELDDCSAADEFVIDGVSLGRRLIVLGVPFALSPVPSSDENAGTSFLRNRLYFLTRFQTQN